MNALRIVAAAYRDGWAFVEQGDRIVLLRPPYHRSRLVEVSRTTVERAVQRHRFDVEAHEVSDWRALIGFLQQKRVEIAEAEGAASLPNSERMVRLVRAAPRYILEKYLNRIESDLILQNELQAALRALAAMSHTDIANMDAALRERVSKLVAACADAMAQERDLEEDLLDNEDDLAASFPSLKKVGLAAAMEYAKRVQKNHQIFAFGS